MTRIWCHHFAKMWLITLTIIYNPSNKSVAASRYTRPLDAPTCVRCYISTTDFYYFFFFESGQTMHAFEHHKLNHFFRWYSLRKMIFRLLCSAHTVGIAGRFCCPRCLLAVSHHRTKEMERRTEHKYSLVCLLRLNGLWQWLEREQ